jgi:hypothetical protein
MVIINGLGNAINYAVVGSGGQPVFQMRSIPDLKEQYVDLSGFFTQHNPYGYLYLANNAQGLPVTSYNGVSRTLNPKDKDAVVKITVVSPE